MLVSSISTNLPNHQYQYCWSALALIFSIICQHSLVGQTSTRSSVSNCQHLTSNLLHHQSSHHDHTTIIVKKTASYSSSSFWGFPDTGPLSFKVNCPLHTGLVLTGAVGVCWSALNSRCILVSCQHQVPKSAFFLVISIGLWSEFPKSSLCIPSIPTTNSQHGKQAHYCASQSHSKHTYTPSFAVTLASRQGQGPCLVCASASALFYEPQLTSYLSSRVSHPTFMCLLTGPTTLPLVL